MAIKRYRRAVFIDSRKKDRNIFFFLLFLDVVIAIDIPFPPIPPHINIAAVLALSIIVIYFYIRAFSLKNAKKNAPFVSMNYSGMTSIPILAYELDISFDEARIILAEYAHKGYLTIIHDSENISEKIFMFSGEGTLASNNESSRSQDVTDEIRSINERLINGNLNVAQSGIFERDEEVM